MLRTYLRRIIPNKNSPAATTTGPFEDTHYVGASICCSGRVNSERPKLTPGRYKVFLDTLAQRYYTPFLSGLSTTYGVILIREAQYVDYVMFNDPMKKG